LAPSNTPATLLIPEDTEGDVVEIRPEAQVIVEKMAETIKEHGGCSLIVDYGDMKCDRNTLRVRNGNDQMSQHWE
jgi:SAM-dependent MidA family methyltransferase